MFLVYEAVRALHVAGGVLGLLVMGVPLLARKGGRLHRGAGKLFAAAMIVAGVSGVAMAAAWLAAPRAFTAEAAVGALRANAVFLATLGLLMLCAVQQMLRALTRKRQAAPRPSRLDLLLPAACVGAGAMAVVVGVVAGAPLHLGFGALAIVTAVGDLRFVLRPLRTPRAWWYQHMSGAMVAMISAVTAFLVIGGRRWLAGLLAPELAWTLWVAPTLVLVPVFSAWTARWRQRFGEGPSR